MRSNTIKFFFAVHILMIISTIGFAYQLKVTNNGELIRWEEKHITIYLDSSLKKIGLSEDVEDAIIAAFETWRSEVNLPIDFSFISAACTAGYSVSKLNTNCVYAADVTTALNADAAGTTILSFENDTGNIVDADIVFHQNAGIWQIYDGAGFLSVYEVALHEVGHFLGMDHSSIDHAIMYEMINLDDSVITTLHSDDIWGGVALYDDGMMEQIGCNMATNFDKPKTLLSVFFSLLYF